MFDSAARVIWPRKMKSQDDFNQMIKWSAAKPRWTFRFGIGFLGAFAEAVCSVTILLGMLNIVPGMDAQIVHQSADRWLAEGAIGGLLVAAIAFWQFN